MGCGKIFTKKNAFPGFTTKQNFSHLNSSDSTKTAADQIVLQKNPSKLARNCIKTSPTKSDGSDIISAYELLQSLEISCAEDFKSLKESTYSFASLYSRFLDEVHASCIPRFRLSKGLKVFMAFRFAQRRESEDLIQIRNRFPYFKVLPKAKKDFETIIELVYLAKHLKKDDGFLKDLLRLEYILKVFDFDEKLCCGNEEGVKVLKESVEEGRRVLRVVENVFYECEVFFRDYLGVKEAIEVGKGFMKTNEVTCEEIVHYIYG